MLDRLAADAHGLRVFVEARLHGFDDVFVFPAFDAALVAGGALGLERACAARLRHIDAQFLTIIVGDVVEPERFANRATIDIFRRTSSRNAMTSSIV